MELTTQSKPLTMRWCIDCHRNPGPGLRPPGEIFSATLANTGSGITVVDDPAVQAQLRSSGPDAWAPTPDLSLIRVAVSGLTGRRVRVASGGVTVVHQGPLAED